MSNVVYVVNCGDTGCDDPGYIAFAQVYATRERAQVYMENSVRDDEESFEVSAKWDKEREMAVLDVGGRQIVYTLDEMEVDQ